MTESEDQNLHAWYEFQMNDDSERVIGFQTQGTTPCILILKMYSKRKGGGPFRFLFSGCIIHNYYCTIHDIFKDEVTGGEIDVEKYHRHR